MGRNWVWVALVVAGCGEDMPPSLVSQVVGPAGAHLEGPGMTLDIPPGALAGSQTITVNYADPAAQGPEAFSRSYQLQPEGLTFSQPVTLKLDVPPGVNGQVQWSLLGRDDLFGFSGLVEDGLAIGQSRHFCKVKSGQNSDDDDSDSDTHSCEDGDGCEPDDPANDDMGGGDMGPSRRRPQQDCRQLCTCTSPDPSLNNSNLCGYDPKTEDGTCPNNPMVPPVATSGNEQLGEHDNESCMGWGWVESKIFLCGCDNAAAGSLCSRPQELSGASGTLECHATYGNATVRTSPPSPSPAPCPSPGSVDRRTCDFSWAGYVGTSVHDTSSCVGYDSPSTTKPGNLSGCQETVLYGEWRPFTGTSAGCRGFIRSDAFPDGRSADNRERCRLTPAQWSKLQDRRAACGMLPRAARADEKANAEQQSWTDTLGTIRHALNPVRAG